MVSEICKIAKLWLVKQSYQPAVTWLYLRPQILILLAVRLLVMIFLTDFSSVYTLYPSLAGRLFLCAEKLEDIILKDSQSFLGGFISFITELTSAKQQVLLFSYMITLNG